MFEDYKEFVKNLNKNEIDVLRNDYTSCWMFSYYFHNKYSLEIKNYECVYKVKVKVSEINLDDGIYSYFMCNNTEFHHFILFVKNEIVTLLSTYGGQKNIIEKIYNKYDFIEKLKN